MSNSRALWGEPALIIGAVTAILSMLVAFGVDVSTEQAEAIKGFVSGVIIPAIGLFAIRSQVTPVVTPVKEGDSA